MGDDFVVHLGASYLRSLYDKAPSAWEKSIGFGNLIPTTKLSVVRKNGEKDSNLIEINMNKKYASLFSLIFEEKIPVTRNDIKSYYVALIADKTAPRYWQDYLSSHDISYRNKIGSIIDFILNPDRENLKKIELYFSESSYSSVTNLIVQILEDDIRDPMVRKKIQEVSTNFEFIKSMTSVGWKCTKSKTMDEFILSLSSMII